MILYGYTKVNSEGGKNGKETETWLFTTQAARNRAMYKDYEITFDAVAEECGFEETDVNGNSKMTEEQFMKEMNESPNMETDVFGLIQAEEYHIQYEPFNTFRLNY